MLQAAWPPQTASDDRRQCPSANAIQCAKKRWERSKSDRLLDAAENGFRMVEALALAIRQFAGEAANGEGKLTLVDALQQSAALADVALWVTSEHRNSIDLYLERLAP